MIDVVETGLDVGIEHPLAAPVGLGPDHLTGIMGRPFRAEPVTRRQKVSLEHRFQDQLRCRHHHPVTHRRDPAAGLARCPVWDVHPPQGGPVARPAARGEPVEEGSHPPSPASMQRYSPHRPGGSLVGSHVNPRSPQNIAVGDLVIKRMESTCPVLLGTAIQHALEGSNRVHALGAADGPSRDLGTHQGSSVHLSCIDEAGALPSRQVVLSCPSPVLRPPPTPSRPLPIAGYRRARFPTARSSRGRGGSPQFPGQPSDRSTPTTPEGSSTPAPGPKTSSMAFTTERWARHPLDPPLTGRKRLTTLARASLSLRTGQLLHPASHPASQPSTEASLPGTQASPRTGLSPAG